MFGAVAPSATLTDVQGPLPRGSWVSVSIPSIFRSHSAAICGHFTIYAAIYLLWSLHCRSTFGICSCSTVNSGTSVIRIGAAMWSSTEIRPVRSLHRRSWIDVVTFKVRSYPVMGPGLPVVRSHSVATPLLTPRSSECERSWADIWVPWPLHCEFQIGTLIHSQPPRHDSYQYFCTPQDRFSTSKS